MGLWSCPSYHSGNRAQAGFSCFLHVPSYFAESLACCIGQQVVKLGYYYYYYYYTHTHTHTHTHFSFGQPFSVRVCVTRVQSSVRVVCRCHGDPHCAIGPPFSSAVLLTWGWLCLLGIFGTAWGMLGFGLCYWHPVSRDYRCYWISFDSQGGTQLPQQNHPVSDARGAEGGEHCPSAVLCLRCDLVCLTFHLQERWQSALSSFLNFKMEMEVLLILSHCFIYLSTDTELRYAQSIFLLLTLFPCSGMTLGPLPYDLV